MSLSVIPSGNDPITNIRRLRKGLRDNRDRAARQDQRWAGVTFAGMLSDRVAMVLIDHRDIDRTAVWWVLSARWPEAVVVDAGNAEPSWRMTVADAAALARCRRGIEPIRVVIMPQIKALDCPDDDAMPIAF